MKITFTLLLAIGFAALPLAAQTPSSTTTNAPAASSVSAPSATDPVEPLATAVLNFQSSDDTLDKQGADAATLLEADLSSSEHANLVERRLFATGNQFVLVAKVMSTETSRVYGVTTTLASMGNLSQGVQDLSGKIDAVLGSHRDVLVAKQEAPDQRLQRLRGLVAQGGLPIVSVKIDEKDYTQETIDPAAQTEITMLLQQLGFQVVDPDQTHKAADITITGEAFSEVGAFHGNLVSGRGRIEIKIVRGTSQELISADRETQIAVAVGARSAGKDALQKAADKLMDRILPKLTK